MGARGGPCAGGRRIGVDPTTSPYLKEPQHKGEGGDRGTHGGWLLLNGGCLQHREEAGLAMSKG